jgi:hypothetical protein
VFYSGLIDDVRIYNRAVSKEEVRELAHILVNDGGLYRDPNFNHNLLGVLDPPNPVILPEEPLPLQNERKRNVAVLVHGWNSSPSVWADDTKIMMETYLYDHGALCDTCPFADPCWEVIVWDWAPAAKTILPEWAYQNTINDKNILTRWLTKRYGRNWNHLHLIGHSAGSKLIDSVAKKLEQQKRHGEPAPTSLHLTFLDPYTPLDSDRADYGKLNNSIIPNFSESYITHNIPTPGILDGLTAGINKGLYDAEIKAAYLVWDKTKGPLTNAYNIYIDGLDSEWFLDRAESSTLWSFQNHAWPYQFYQCSITPDNVSFFGDGFQTSHPCPDKHDRYGFGFVNSLEYASCNTTTTLRGNWKPELSCTAYSTTLCTDPLGTFIEHTVVNAVDTTVDWAKATVSTTGTVMFVTWNAMSLT